MRRIPPERAAAAVRGKLFDPLVWDLPAGGSTARGERIPLRTLPSPRSTAAFPGLVAANGLAARLVTLFSLGMGWGDNQHKTGCAYQQRCDSSGWPRDAEKRLHDTGGNQKNHRRSLLHKAPGLDADKNLNSAIDCQGHMLGRIVLGEIIPSSHGGLAGVEAH